MDRQSQNLIARNIVESAVYLKKLEEAVLLHTRKGVFSPTPGNPRPVLVDFHKYERIHGRTVGLVREYFLAFDYARLSDAQLKDFFCKNSRWLMLCIAWPGRREFIQDMLGRASVPDEMKAFTLYLALMEEWAVDNHGWSCEGGHRPWFDSSDKENGEESLAVSLDNRPASGVAIFMDMAGIELDRWLLGVFIIKGRPDLLQLMLDRSSEKFLAAYTGMDIVDRIVGCAKGSPFGRYGDAPLGVHGKIIHRPEECAPVMWGLIAFAKRNFPEELSRYCNGFDPSRIREQ